MNVANSQGYAKDSLQIKVYTEILYKNNIATEITLKKVFCDYCSNTQNEAIAKEAIRRSNLEKYEAYNRLQNGIKRIATYIRVSKKDFAALNEKDN
ncbi:hypothetical protein GCM10022271_22180 [Corallibacter vietnamensis]|uniref:Uncharacterized protein n=1 Tax=Corallibacter vietnamensis TaxID=904130 RepID=A0ABP7HHP9_9FLAO